jgi:transposase-like protein
VSTRSRRKFTPDFKAEAVEMVEAAGGNIAQVAKELGIYDSTLGNWVRQAREQAAGAPTAQERAEIRDLMRELAIRHDLLVAYYHVVRDRVPFEELGADWLARRYSVEHRTARLVRQLEALGHSEQVVELDAGQSRPSDRPSCWTRHGPQPTRSSR